MFSIYHVNSPDHVVKELCDLMGWSLLQQVTTNFCGHSSYGSSDTAAKIVYMTLQDHVIKGYVDLWREIPHWMSSPCQNW